MSEQELERLVRKYYGYLADLEGSGGEAFDLLFVRDRIQRILEESLPEEEISNPLFEHLHELDDLLWAEREAFLVVVGERELQHARKQQRSPRSQWWWYLDALQTRPHLLREQQDRLAQVCAEKAGSEYFLTCDHQLTRRYQGAMSVTNPIEFALRVAGEP